MYVPATPAQPAPRRWLPMASPRRLSPSVAPPPVTLDTSSRVRSPPERARRPHASVTGSRSLAPTVDSPGGRSRCRRSAPRLEHARQALTPAPSRSLSRALRSRAALGSERVRLRFAGDASDLGTHRRLGRLNVYRLAGASWYGGGGGLACGGQLTSATMGVANKTLPCGTQVTLRYGGHTVRVPVVDRGPYVAGREFDLTEATKQALGFGDTGEVWSTR